MIIWLLSLAPCRLGLAMRPSEMSSRRSWMEFTRSLAHSPLHQRLQQQLQQMLQTRRLQTIASAGVGPQALQQPRRWRLTVQRSYPLMRFGAEQKLLEVPMLNAKGTGVSLHLKTGNRVFIMNRSEAEVCLPRGSVVAGFGRGKFKRVGPKETSDNAKEVPYRLEGPDTEVVGHN